jgi:hypothetical protein
MATMFLTLKLVTAKSTFVGGRISTQELPSNSAASAVQSVIIVIQWLWIADFTPSAGLICNTNTFPLPILSIHKDMFQPCLSKMSICLRHAIEPNNDGVCLYAADNELCNNVETSPFHANRTWNLLCKQLDESIARQENVVVMRNPSATPTLTPSPPRQDPWI